MTKKLYEAMFLIDSAQAGSDWDGTMAAVKRVLKRADAEIAYLEKWVDRKLAFEIAHKTRGTYILCYFRAEGSKIAGIEKDVNLSEQIMRVLILTAEDRPGDSVKRDLAGETKAPQELYVRDDRRPGSRRHDDASSAKADARDKASAETAPAEAAKDTGTEPATTVAPEAEASGETGDAESAAEAPKDLNRDVQTSVAEQEVPTEEDSAAGAGESDTEPEKE